MKPIFSRGPSLQFRLILAVLVALGVIIADSRLGTFSQIRTYMDTAVSPFYFISNGPRELLDSVSQTLSSRDQLELENRALRQELLLKNSELLMLGQYKQENARLRELLGSPLRQDEQKMVTQVISTVNDPYSDQVVIDKGSVNGVYEGQPVIIWIDARPQTLLNALGSRDYLLNVFDSHPTDRRQNIKYGSIVLNNRYNIINTVISWDEFLKGLVGEYVSSWDGRVFKSEDIIQAYRRFPVILPLLPSCYEVLLNNGWLDPDGDFKEYIAYRKIQGNFGKMRLLLQKAGYTPETVQALGEKYDEELTAPAIEVIKEKIESIQNNREVDISSPEAPGTV